MASKTGTAYFALKTLPEGLAFATPQGSVVTESMLLNAATGTRLLKGYVKVDKSASEVGVLEGGKLIVRTADGRQTINTGQRIILAQSNLGGGGAAAGGGAGAGGGISAGTIAALVITSAAVLTFAGIGISGMNDNKEGSPFTPSN